MTDLFTDLILTIRAILSSIIKFPEDIVLEDHCALLVIFYLHQFYTLFLNGLLINVKFLSILENKTININRLLLTDKFCFYLVYLIILHKFLF